MVRPRPPLREEGEATGVRYSPDAASHPPAPDRAGEQASERSVRARRAQSYRPNPPRPRTKADRWRHPRREPDYCLTVSDASSMTKLVWRALSSTPRKPIVTVW